VTSNNITTSGRGQLTDESIIFTHDIDNMMLIWEINAEDEVLVGTYHIYLKYEIQSEYQVVPFNDTKARFVLKLM
jgi:hypothetical protein